MTAGSSMLARILSCPPQRAHWSIATPNTRLSRRAQLIATGRGVAGCAPAQAGRFPRRNKLGVMPLDQLLQQRRFGAVPHVPGRIDQRWSTQADCPLARHGLASLRWMDATTLRRSAHW